MEEFPTQWYLTSHLTMTLTVASHLYFLVILGIHVRSSDYIRPIDPDQIKVFDQEVSQISYELEYWVNVVLMSMSLALICMALIVVWFEMGYVFVQYWLLDVVARSYVEHQMEVLPRGHIWCCGLRITANITSFNELKRQQKYMVGYLRMYAYVYSLQMILSANLTWDNPIKAVPKYDLESYGNPNICDSFVNFQTNHVRGVKVDGGLIFTHSLHADRAKFYFFNQSVHQPYQYCGDLPMERFNMNQFNDRVNAQLQENYYNLMFGLLIHYWIWNSVSLIACLHSWCYYNSKINQNISRYEEISAERRAHATA